MLSKLRPRLSSAHVIACVALFVALGGSSFAAPAREAASRLITGKAVKNGSLTGSDIRNGSLTGSDVRNGSLTGSDTRNGSLTTSDVRNGSLLARDFRAGQLPRGATGPAGPQGVTGRQGPPGPTQYARVNADGTLADGSASSAAPTATGSYVVRFPGSVSRCAVTATTGTFSGSAATDAGAISLSVGYGTSPDPNAVAVQTRDGAGSIADRSFMLILACP